MLRFLVWGCSWWLMTASFANSIFNPSTGKLFIPYVNVGEQVYSAELKFAADTGLLEITQVKQRLNDLIPAYGSSTPLTLEGTLSLPRINVDGNLYQADLVFQAADNAMLISNLQVVDENLPERGSVVANALKAQYSQAQIQQIISLYALQTGLSINLKAQNAIALYKLSYQTIDPAGNLTPASALLALPVGLDTARPLVAVQHGTMVLDSAALSEALLDTPSIGLAATGYVVVAADYLGFGDSAGLHPYVHAHSLATAVIDALRAGKTAAQDQGVTLSGQLFLVGYSEGGYATLAAQREIEAHYSHEFSITASAPMAGSYDLSGSMVQRALDATPHSNPYYFSYMALMLARVYGGYDGLTELFTTPYSDEMLNYFDGQHSSSAINALLPPSQLAVFTPQVYADLSNPESWITASLRANDLLRWKPAVPTRLYHCVKDEQVPFANSQAAYDSFQALGASQVELISVDDAQLNQGEVHANCSVPIMLMAKDWFDSLL